MEYRLLFFGFFFLVYYFLTKRFEKREIYKNPLRSALWHGAFCFIGGALAMMIVISSLEVNKEAVSVYHIPKTHILLGLIFASASFAWGFLRNFRKDPDDAKIALTENKDWAQTIASAMFLATVFIYFFAQAFKIPSASMRMTLLEGDHLFVNKLVYGLKIPFTDKRILPLKKIERGDVVVFRFPSEDAAEVHCGGSQYGKDFVKRVIALEGETVELKNGQVLIDGKYYGSEPYMQHTDLMRMPGVPAEGNKKIDYQKVWEQRNLGRTFGHLLRDEFGPVKVPKDAYFVMGDNRDHSCDSRFWGPVYKNTIKGSAWFVYWPLSRIKGIR